MEYLTNAQKSIWVTEQYYKGTSINNISGSTIFEEKIDFDKLKQAIEIVCSKNDNFRLKFKIANGDLMQFVSNDSVNINIFEVEDYNEMVKKRDYFLKKPFQIENTILFNYDIYKFKDDTGAMVFTMHHLVGDAWTGALVHKEIVKTYNSLIKNNFIENRQVYSYIDYTQSEKDYKLTDKFQRDKNYWESKFQHIPEVATIPSSKKKTIEIDNAIGKRKEYKIDKNKVALLKNYCKINKISLYNFFIAIYAIYISGITNLDEFVIGTPILNRTNFKEKNTMGMFVNIAPLKINLENVEDFKTFIKNISTESFGMLKHQKYSYQSLIEDLRKKNNTQKLYNILLSYQITDTSLDDGDIKYRTEWTFNGYCADAIDIQIFDLNNTGYLNIAYDYKTNIYEETDIENLHKRILNIINQVINNDNISLKDIDIITPEEKQKLIYDFNKTNLDYNKNIPIIKYFEAQAENTPNNIAVVFENKKMTYKELNEKANSLAFDLRKNGVSNNTIVGIMLDRSFEMIIAIIAVLKAGGGYIPIAPDYPTKRIQYMLEDSNASILLTNNNKLKTDKKILDINSIDYSKNKQNLKNISNPQDLSYLIYTSGSTGTPKGVMLTQKNLTNFYNSIKKNIKYLNDEHQHKIVSITSVSFDIFIFESLISLTRGLTLFITNEKEQKISLDLENIIKENQIEILQTTPSVMRFHLDNLKDPLSLKSLKYIILAGEQLPKSLVERLKDIIPGLTVYNGYGPSETTIFSAIADVTNLSNITIGKPISNTQIYILNKNQKLLPQGSIGEIYISGDGVGKGYINKKEQTNSNFIKNPFQNDSIMYKTGDLGSFNDDGSICCYGRVDNQVKIRGLRIELSEIEKQLLSIYNISDCVVVKRVVNEKDALCAYYISNGPVDENVFKTVLKSKLPQYMVPQYFVKLKKLPYTPNGKIDRKALPEPNTQENKKTLVEPRNELDKELIQIIKKLLRVDNVSILDTLLDLGGDSLTTIALSTDILSKYNVEIGVKHLLSDYTIKDISDYIKENRNMEISKIEIEKMHKQDTYPLSSAQKRIYYASKISSNSLVYNVSGGLLVDAILDEKKVKNAFNTIIKEHSIFRTCFKIIEGTPKQVVLDNVSFDIKVHFDKDINIKKLVDNFPKPFIFENAPLLRVELHYIDNNQTLLLIDTHHIIVDGISLNILIDNFCKKYKGDNIPKEKIEYKDYTLWEQKFNNSKKIKTIENNWLNIFKNIDIPVINLPYDYPVTIKKNFRGDVLYKNIPKYIFESIEQIAKKNKVSPYVIFLTAFYTLLHRYTGQDTIIIGSPIAGRYNHDLENTIGMFVNNISLLINIDSQITFADLMLSVNKTVIDALDNQPYPYDMLIKKLNLNVNNSLFDVVFTYQNENVKMQEIENKFPDIIYANTKTSKYNLTLEIDPNTKIVKFEYNTNLFKEITVDNMLEHYIFILEQIVKNINIQLMDIDMISEKEKILLEKFNNTDDIINDDTVVDLIENQVELNPNNVAVICEGKVLTYKELDQNANSLANHLIQKGVKNNDIVCIMTNRSLETIIAMVAILKAGGAFLNIDPTYPLDRTKYYIESSKSKYVLTQSSLKSFVQTFPNCIEIDLDTAPIYNSNFEKPKVNIKKQSLSYIIYTSGSTGIPKGVMLNQVGLANMAKAMTKALDYLHDGKIHTLLSVTSTPFDIFVYEIIVSLTHGQRIIMANNQEHRNPKLLDSLIKKYNVDVMTVTPSLMKILYDNRQKNSSLGLVKNMVFGGEPLPEKFVKDLKSLADDITIFNIYGPSEITILSNVQNLNGEKEISTGAPIMNTQIHILDKNLNRVPIGVIGEIYISGIQVGVGYLGNPKLTRENFLPNKFGKGKMYKSGDLGRWTFDGKVQCLGRVDHQIKLRGLRIELGEIESRIAQIKGISSVVVNKINVNGKDVLCGYYVVEDSMIVKESQVKSYLKKYLPQYMIPTYIMQLDKMPYTINRKIDRKSLPIPRIEDKSFVEENPDNFNSSELKLLQIWKNILHLKNINLTDNFFEIGGDSISAIKMQIEALKYDFKFEYADIFKYPTIKELSKNKLKSKKENLENYDYSIINNVLQRNNEHNISTIKRYKVGNILIIGSTGYLGIHILDAFLRSENGIAYCLIRRKNNQEPIDRLHNKINFYFNNNYWNKYKNRIKIIEGDIVKNNLSLSIDDYNLLKNSISTVINAGALVKHYGTSKLFEEINVVGTQNIVNFCLKEKKRLIHISTISVSGNGEKDEKIIETKENINTKKIFKENTLYIKQKISGIYTLTKYKAEMIVLNSINDGLDAQILRIGNITNRYCDGVFQQNVDENAFAKRLKSFIEIGYLPEYLLSHALELSPVDLCADAVVKVLQHNSICNVVHIYNPKLLEIKLLLETLKELKINISPVSDDEMSKILVKILNTNSRKNILDGIIHDIDSEKKLIYTSNVRIDYNFSEKYLEKINFKWKNIDKKYILKYMEYFNKIKFINYKKE